MYVCIIYIYIKTAHGFDYIIYIYTQGHDKDTETVKKANHTRAGPESGRNASVAAGSTAMCPTSHPSAVEVLGHDDNSMAYQPDIEAEA